MEIHHHNWLLNLCMYLGDQERLKIVIYSLYINKSRTHKQFSYLGAKCWNILPQSLRQAKSAKEFSNELKKMLLSSIKIDVKYVVNNQFDLLYKPVEGNLGCVNND